LHKPFKIISILTISLLCMSACTDNPYNAKQGAIIGATAGIMSGFLTGALCVYNQMINLFSFRFNNKVYKSGGSNAISKN